MAEYLNGIHDFADTLWRFVGVMPGDVVKKAVEVVQDFWGQGIHDEVQPPNSWRSALIS
jgi:hypothetical protein